MHLICEQLGPTTLCFDLIARNAAAAEAGLDLRITPAAMFGVSYSGQFACAATVQSLKGNFIVKF